jgi:hypothetical protein
MPTLQSILDETGLLVGRIVRSHQLGRLLDKIAEGTMGEKRVVVETVTEKSGKVRVVTHDPRTGRRIDTNTVLPGKQVEQHVEKLKEILQRTGARVDVHEG